jgi:sugar-specific transcriptional regulator TrmB
MESIIESLEKFGLTRYEAKAYIGMTNLISGKAEEIARASEIPRSKIYNTLKQLDKKGFITITHTRPLEYHVVPPNEIFKNKKDELIKELESSQEKLDEIYNDNISEIQAPVWLIKTSENIINKEIEIIKRARKSINMRIGFLLEGEGQALIKAFKELPRGVPIKILATPECYIDGEKLEIIKMFEEAKLDNLEIIETDIKFVKIVIRDGKELFRTIVKFTGEEKSILPETSVGVQNRYEDICQNFDERFLNQFNKMKAKKNKKNKGKTE